jgi:hypothetical protein
MQKIICPQLICNIILNWYSKNFFGGYFHRKYKDRLFQTLNLIGNRAFVTTYLKSVMNTNQRVYYNGLHMGKLLPYCQTLD